METFETATLVSAIVATFDSANETQVADGTEWYPAMARIMREHAHVTGLTVEQCAAVYAACSINTRWAQNVKLATRALADGGLHGGTLGMICDKVNRVMAERNTDNLDEILSSDKANLKIKNFRRNLLDMPEIVTVDRWAYRVATKFAGCEFGGDKPCARDKHGNLTGRDHACGKVPTGAEYRQFAEAYTIAASMRGVTPATMQAVTWCVVRGDGE